MSTSSVLYVGAIPYNWDVEVIKSVVLGSGPVVDVRCMMDNAAKNKGFCFVEYSTPSDAVNALSLLTKIRIEGSRKKIRVELSKEGLRNSMHLNKPTLKLNRLLMPSNVLLPPEMTQFDNQIDVAASIESDSDSTPNIRKLKMAIAKSLETQKMVSQMLANGMDLMQISKMVLQFNNSTNTPGANLPNVPNVPNLPNIPNMASPSVASSNINLPIIQNQHQNQPHLNASSFLPPLTSTMQSDLSSDTISKTLSTIPPGVLIELMAKLKLTLSNPSASNYQEAISILQENPKLAVAAAQALLLMGVIDTNVIANAQSTPIQSQQNLQPQPVQQNPATLPPMPNLNQNTNNSPQPIPSQHIPSAWLGLPQHTISKLLLLQPAEADLIVQVLSLPPQQLSTLPEQERSMALQIRNQYL